MFILKILKAFFDRLLIFVLSLLTIAVATIWIFTATLGNQSVVSGWFVDAGVYDSLPDTIFDLVQDEVEKGGAGESSATIKIEPLRMIFKESYDSAFLQSQFDEGLNGMYGWMQSDTDKPVFTLSLRPHAEVFTSKASVELKSQLNALPACSGATLDNSRSLFNLTCLPPGIDASREVDTFMLSLADFDTPVDDNDKFLTGEYTGDKFNDKFGSDLEILPSVFTKTGVIMSLMTAVIVLIIGLMVFFVKDKSHRLKSIGSTFISAALSIGFSAIFLKFGSKFSKEFYDSISSSQMKIINDGVVDKFSVIVADSIVGVMIKAITILVAIGAAMWLVGFWMEHRRVSKHAASVGDLKEANLPADSDSSDANSSVDPATEAVSSGRSASTAKSAVKKVGILVESGAEPVLRKD